MQSGARLKAALIALIMLALMMPLFSPDSFASADSATDNAGLSTTSSQNSQATSATADVMNAFLLPNQTFTATVYTDSTLTTTTADEQITISGNLPSGGYATAYPVKPSLAGESILAAYDISVYYHDGTKFEPDDSLSVSITLPSLPAGVQSSDLSLVYIPEGNQQPETIITPVRVSGRRISFAVQHFSTYAIVMSSVTAATIQTNGGSLVNIALTQSTTQINNLDYYYQLNPPDTLAAGATSNLTLKVNSNLTIQSMTINGVPSSNFTKGTGGTATVTYGMNTQVVLVCYRTTQNDYVTVTLDIPVNTPLQISDAVIEDGQLNALYSGTDTVLSYTWYKSDSASGPFVAVTTPNAISADGSSVNVSYDNGAQMFYEVVATVDDGSGGTAQITSAPYQVPFYSSLQNGDFEDPSTTLRSSSTGKTFGTNANYANFSNGTVGLVWQTTGQDMQTEIATNPPLGTYGVKAAKGTRFAELDANYVGTIYQDVLVTPGETLYWSLAHAGRLGNDTMNVVIMPSVDLSTIIVPGNPTGAGNGVSVLLDDGLVSETTITDNKGSWDNGNNGANYTGSYVVPAGIYVVRFYFVSVSSSGGDPTQGNLLDDITFNSDMPYTVQYYLDGVLQTADTESGRAPTDTIVSAQNTSQFADYTLQRVVLTSQDASHTILPNGTYLGRTTSFPLTIPDSVLQLYYVTSGVFVDKALTGVAPGDIDTTYTATFGLSQGGTSLSTATVAMVDGSVDGSIQFFDKNGHPIVLTAGTEYTMTELSYDEVPNYAYTATTAQAVTGVIDSVETTLMPVAGGPSNSITFVAEDGVSVYQAYFANAYRKTAMNFTFYKEAPDGTPLAGVSFSLTPQDSSGTGWDTSSAVTTLSASPDGQVSFTNLDTGTYLLQETSTQPGYALPAGDWVLEVDAASGSISITAQGSPMAFAHDSSGDLVLYNYPNWATPFTGNTFGVSLLTVVGVSLIGLALLKAKHLEKKSRVLEVTSGNSS